MNICPSQGPGRKQMAHPEDRLKRLYDRTIYTDVGRVTGWEAVKGLGCTMVGSC